TSVYPKLLLDEKYADRLDPILYQYAIFRDGEFIRNSGTFNYLHDNFLKILDQKSLLNEGIQEAGYHHLGITNGDELIVISSKNISVSHFFGNISLYFVAFVFLTFLAILFNTLIKG